MYLLLSTVKVHETPARTMLPLPAIPHRGTRFMATMAPVAALAPGIVEPIPGRTTGLQLYTLLPYSTRLISAPFGHTWMLPSIPSPWMSS